MSYNINDLFVARNSRSGYQIEQSLRFDRAANSYLSDTPSSEGNRRTYTISMWVKTSLLGSTNRLMGVYAAAGDYEEIQIDSGGNINWYHWGGSYSFRYITNAKLRDPSAWYHFVFVSDTTNATANDRHKIYINGVDQTFSTRINPSQNFQADWNRTQSNTLGTLLYNNSPGNTLDGYMAEVYHVDGRALDPTSFGEFDNNGVWRPIEVDIPNSHAAGFTGNPTNPQNGFDGSTATLVENPSNGNTVSWTGSIPCQGTVRMYWSFGGGAGQSGLAYVNGTDISSKIQAIVGSGGGSGFINITTEAGSEITSFQWTDVTGVFDGSFGGFEVDGAMVTDDQTYGLNGFYLTFDPTATNGIGHDHSGNGNNWTPSSFTTSGTGTDVMSDTPTTNWCTLNPLDANGGNFFNGNLEYAGPYSSFSSQNGHGCRSTLLVPSSGKWYVEAANVTYSGSGNSCMLGFTSSKQAFTATAFGGNLTPWIGVDASVYNNNIRLYWNGVSGGTASNTQLFAGCASGDVVNLAIDFDNGKFWVGKNGTWYNSGNPAAGTNPTSTFTAGTDEWAFWGEYVAASDNSNRSSVLVNFGQRAFEYTLPTGFSALNTSNLPAPNIADGSDYFNTVLYTGNGSTQSITGVGFQPDWVWMKSRTEGTANYTGHNVVQDAVRGTGTNTALVTNENYSESGTGYSNALTAFNSDGFSLGARNQVNYNGDSFVAWNWLAGGSGSSNTDGTVTSTVSANPSAGFSIATFTTTLSGSGSQTFGHGLGVAPSLVIVKARSQSYSWGVYHKSLGATKLVYLDGTSGANTATFHFNNTAPTSSVVTLGYGSATGAAADRVAYCFAEVEGYSKFGSYAGNGNAEGPFVWCGFRPALVIWKQATGANDRHWVIRDSVRDPDNPLQQTLYPSISTLEQTLTAQDVDFLSNGFKIKTTWDYLNTSNETYIFMAFAENPFGGSGVSPATAR